MDQKQRDQEEAELCKRTAVWLKHKELEGNKSERRAGQAHAGQPAGWVQQAKQGDTEESRESGGREELSGMSTCNARSQRRFWNRHSCREVGKQLRGDWPSM